MLIRPRQQRPLPRRRRYDTTGRLSYHAILAPQDGQTECEPSRRNPSGCSRWITTLRKEPMHAPASAATAAIHAPIRKTRPLEPGHREPGRKPPLFLAPSLGVHPPLRRVRPALEAVAILERRSPRKARKIWDSGPRGGARARAAAPAARGGAGPAAGRSPPSTPSA